MAKKHYSLLVTWQVFNSYTIEISKQQTIIIDSTINQWIYNWREETFDNFQIRIGIWMGQRFLVYTCIYVGGLYACRYPILIRKSRYSGCLSTLLVTSTSHSSLERTCINFYVPKALSHVFIKENSLIIFRMQPRGGKRKTNKST